MDMSLILCFDVRVDRAFSLFFHYTADINLNVKRSKTEWLLTCLLMINEIFLISLFSHFLVIIFIW